MEVSEPNKPKKYIFKNNQNQELPISMSSKNEKLNITTQMNEIILDKKLYSSDFSLDEIKEKNKFFFLSKNLNDVLTQIEILLKENKSYFKKESNVLLLIIPTNMALAPEIIFELKEIDKIKIEDINNYINYINYSEKKDDNNLSLLLKENKEMKEKIKQFRKSN